MASFRMKVLGSAVLVSLAIVLAVGAVYSMQASQKMTWTGGGGQTSITLSLSDRDYIGNALIMYGTIANSVIAVILLSFAAGILIVK